MKKEQFINLIESINHVVESRRGYGYEYGREPYANFPTEAEVPSGGYDDPAAVASGLFGTPARAGAPAQVHTPAKHTVTPVAPKEMGASGRQLSLASYMPHAADAYHPYPYMNDPIIKDNLHGFSPDIHARSLEMAKKISVNHPETIRNFGRFLVNKGVDPAHPHIQGLFKDADFHDQINYDKYSRY